jgi:hypothetical protein
MRKIFGGLLFLLDGFAGFEFLCGQSEGGDFILQTFQGWKVLRF